MQQWHRKLAAAAVLLAIAAAGIAGYLVGHHTAGVTIATGTAYVARDFATAKVDGWSYAIPLDISWQGYDGSWHKSGRPECIPEYSLGHQVPVRFGWIPVTGPDGTAAWRQAVWVSCPGLFHPVSRR